MCIHHYVRYSYFSSARISLVDIDVFPRFIIPESYTCVMLQVLRANKPMYTIQLCYNVGMYFGSAVVSIRHDMKTELERLGT